MLKAELAFWILVVWLRAYLTAFLTVLQYYFCEDDRGRERARKERRKEVERSCRVHENFSPFLLAHSKITPPLPPSHFSVDIRRSSGQDSMYRSDVSFQSQSNEDVVCFPSVLLSPLIAEEEDPEVLEEGQMNDQVECFPEWNNQMGLCDVNENNLICYTDIILGLSCKACNSP